jgi:uncharacterized protein (DUF2141 family)
MSIVDLRTLTHDAIPRGARRVATALALGVVGIAITTPALAQYKQELRNDPHRCAAGAGPAIAVTVDGIKSSSGNLRVQSYRATSSDWLQKGRWLSRIEQPARAGSMTFCMPVPSAGDYAIAVRHDVNGNGETDISTDGGAMSNNPSINIFNLGRPSVNKTAFPVGKGVKAIRVQLKYL